VLSQAGHKGRLFCVLNWIYEAFVYEIWRDHLSRVEL